MLLAIDTATRWLGVALYDGRNVVAELGWQCVNNHTVELAPTVENLWRRTGITAKDITGIGIAIGPGSYTGLRVGLGFAKGISLVQRTPLIGISTLDCIAISIGRLPGTLVTVVEAGRTRICAGTYHYHPSHGWQAEQAPDIYRWEELLTQLSGKVHFVGEVSEEARKLIRKQAKRWQVLPAIHGTRRAGNLAYLSWQRLEKGDVDDPATLVPVYLRDPASQ